jgi:hypothetical protein
VVTGIRIAVMRVYGYPCTEAMPVQMVARARRAKPSFSYLI